MYHNFFIYSSLDGQDHINVMLNKETHAPEVIPESCASKMTPASQRPRPPCWIASHPQLATLSPAHYLLSYLQTVERAVEAGDMVLIENLEESIDPVLGPLLGREVIKKGRWDAAVLRASQGAGPRPL